MNLTEIQSYVADAQKAVDAAKSYGIDPKVGRNDAGELIKAAGLGVTSGAGTGAALAGSIGLAFPPFAPIAAAIGAAVGAIIGAIAGLFSKLDFNVKSFDYGDPVKSAQLERDGTQLAHTLTTILNSVPEPGRSALSETLYKGFIAAGPPIYTDKNGVSTLLGFPVILPAQSAPGGKYVYLTSLEGLASAAANLDAQVQSWIKQGTPGGVSSAPELAPELAPEMSGDTSWFFTPKRVAIGLGLGVLFFGVKAARKGKP